jgi:hypothetical protein
MRRAPTSRERAVLTHLACGDYLEVDVELELVRLGLAGAAILPDVGERLLLNGWITAPAPFSTLLGEPARPGRITEAGLRALERRTEA